MLTNIAKGTLPHFTLSGISCRGSGETDEAEK